MKNLLKETEKILKECNKDIDDIVWVGTYNHFVNKEDFIKLADTDYDGGYGGVNVATNLLIVGNDWWLERDEYDGSEWWEYKTIPHKPAEELKLKALTVEQACALGQEDCFSDQTLEDLNNNAKGE